ncbi:MAG: F0F1 ATP synthase subunit B [Puniceicoccales bacterium]|jgi:F-type H+-transporting ATPase subunit b|nr:F0F1 ATP synthase subunit B [Puniceicoccales bacterium]
MFLSRNLVFAAAGAIERFGLNWHDVALHLASFTLMAVVLYFFGIKPLLANLDARNARIEDGLRFSEEMKARLAEAEKHYEERLAEAATEAAKIASAAGSRAKAFEEKALHEARERAAGVLQRASEQLAHERTQMFAELRTEVARLVVDTAGKVLARELSPAERTRYNSVAARELENT